MQKQFCLSTRDTIIQIADDLIRDKGYNAFSFYDISKAIGIKTASIHYHFPTKTDLSIALIKEHHSRLEKLKKYVADKSPFEKMEGFLSIYVRIQEEKKVCLVGSLATDLHTVDERTKQELQSFAGEILEWVTQILEEGKSKSVFDFPIPARTKALMIISNMLAIVQLSRLTSAADFILVKENILRELKPNTNA